MSSFISTELKKIFKCLFTPSERHSEERSRSTVSLSAVCTATAHTCVCLSCARSEPFFFFSFKWLEAKISSLTQNLAASTYLKPVRWSKKCSFFGADVRHLLAHGVKKQFQPKDFLKCWSELFPKQKMLHEMYFLLLFFFYFPKT